MVGRRGIDHINIAASEDFAVILIRRAIIVTVMLIHAALLPLQLRLTNIIHRDDLNPLKAQELSHHRTATRTDPQTSHDDAITRRRHAIGSQSVGSNDLRKGDRRNASSLEEIASRIWDFFHNNVS